MSNWFMQAYIAMCYPDVINEKGQQICVRNASFLARDVDDILGDMETINVVYIPWLEINDILTVGHWVLVILVRRRDASLALYYTNSLSSNVCQYPAIAEFVAAIGCTCHRLTSTQQTNDVDCGFFVIANLRILTEDLHNAWMDKKPKVVREALGRVDGKTIRDNVIRDVEQRMGLGRRGRIPSK